MLFPTDIIDQIAKSAYWADRTIRAELAEGLIASENDYTSNLTSMLRRQINARSIPNLHASSYVLRPSLERAVGADACIVLSNGVTFKLCIFEAKWPRLSTHRNCWDSLQKSTGKSHFDEQLARQARFNRRIATWEMFYSESPFGLQPPFMPSHVSSCVWHDDAMAASIARANRSKPWTDLELTDLLTASSRQIDDVLREVCDCSRGSPFQGSNYSSAFDEIGLPREILVIESTPPNRQ